MRNNAREPHYRGQEVCKDASLPPVMHSLPNGEQKEIWKSPLCPYQTLAE